MERNFVAIILEDLVDVSYHLHRNEPDQSIVGTAINVGIRRKGPVVARDHNQSNLPARRRILHMHAYCYDFCSACRTPLNPDQARRLLLVRPLSLVSQYEFGILDSLDIPTKRQIV